MLKIFQEPIEISIIMRVKFNKLGDHIKHIKWFINIINILRKWKNNKNINKNF